VLGVQVVFIYDVDLLILLVDALAPPKRHPFWRAILGVAQAHVVHYKITYSPDVEELRIKGAQQ